MDATGSRDLVILHGEIQTPPLSRGARSEAGYLLRRIQQGESLGMPLSRPMPSIGPRVHELRITDENTIWRIVYRSDSDALLILSVFQKTTQATPKSEIDNCKRRLSLYDEAVRESVVAKEKGGRR
jgi:phage-related protein